MAKDEVAVVAGAGSGLGAALVRRFAHEGMRVAALARKREKIETLATETARASGGTVEAHPVDVTDEAAVGTVFDEIRANWAEPDLVVYNAGAYLPQGILETTSKEFEQCWRIGCLGGLHVAQQAARGMVERGNGTILFTGATASLRGSARFFNLAVGKFGLRALAQCMARELGPKGVHIGHIVIDGEILLKPDDPRAKERAPNALLDPDEIAETYLQLHRQRPSAWALEVDLRPWVEKF